MRNSWNIVFTVQECKTIELVMEIGMTSENSAVLTLVTVGLNEVLVRKEKTSWQGLRAPSVYSIPIGNITILGSTSVSQNNPQGFKTSFEEILRIWCGYSGCSGCCRISLPIKLQCNWKELTQTYHKIFQEINPIPTFTTFFPRISFQLKMSIASLHMHSQGKWSPVSDHKSWWARHGIDNVVLAAFEGPTKSWKLPPVFHRKKTDLRSLHQGIPSWGLAPCLDLFFGASIWKIQILGGSLETQEFGLTREPETKFDSIRGPGRPRGPGGPGKAKLISFQTFLKKYG